MSHPRLIAIDVDGTLVDERLVVSEQDKMAIAASCAAGNVVCLASGRLFAASLPIARQLDLHGPIIVLQGAAGYEIGTFRALFCTPLAQATALHAYDEMRARNFHVQLYYGDRLYLDALNEEARYYLALSRVEPVMVPDLRELLTHPPGQTGPLKILAVGRPEQVLASIPPLSTALGPAANVFRSLPRFLEVTDPQANKGEALRQVAQVLGIPMAWTAAIGDSDNDVPMLKAAARSFAVAGATQAAKNAAQDIVSSLGSGVAQALQALGQVAREA